MIFDNVKLPDDVEQGAVGGPQWYTSVVVMASGREVRNQNWQAPKLVYNIGYGIRHKTDFAAVLAFFYARRGRLRAFRFKDWSDYEGLNEPLGTGDGALTTFQLVRNYTDSIAPYQRKVILPVAGTLNVFKNGVASTAYTIDANGLITFTTAPAAGVAITATYQFDVPMRFDSDVMQLAMSTFDAASVQSIMITEVVT